MKEMEIGIVSIQRFALTASVIGFLIWIQIYACIFLNIGTISKIPLDKVDN